MFNYFWITSIFFFKLWTRDLSKKYPLTWIFHLRFSNFLKFSMFQKRVNFFFRIYFEVTNFVNSKYIPKKNQLFFWKMLCVTYLDNDWLVHFLSVEGGLGTKLWVLVITDHIALYLLPLADYLNIRVHG